jgi:ABC-type transport system involved in multi-copper enzyme maturation permease subunit
MEIAMFSILIKKELRAIIYSPKFTVTFAVCAVLMLLSVYIGINEYNQSVTQYRTAQELAEQRMSETTAWPNLTNKAQREPNPLQIFTGGLNYDIGRWSLINRENSIKLQHTHYSDNPIYAVFRIIDFSFIVQFILTLFAILFTFDAVNGEREKGTLQLVFSNPVSRARYLLAKCAGSWLGLVIPISIPILLSLLLVLIFKVPRARGIDIDPYKALQYLLFDFPGDLGDPGSHHPQGRSAGSRADGLCTAGGGDRGPARRFRKRQMGSIPG